MDIKILVGMIVGVIMLLAVGVPISASLVNTVTLPTLVSNETYTSAGNLNGSFYTVSKLPIDFSNAGITISNGTGAVYLTAANYTVYYLNAANYSYNGTIFFNNVALSGMSFGNTTKISYYYQQPGYDPSSIDEVVLRIIPLAFVVAVLVLIFSVIAV